MVLMIQTKEMIGMTTLVVEPIGKQYRYNQGWDDCLDTMSDK